MDKQQVIDTYIENNSKKGILGFLGINKMLGIDDAMKKYLNGDISSDIKGTKNFGDFLKTNILINFFLKNKKNELDKLKEYLDLNKDNKAQLESLANEIKKGTEIKKALSEQKTLAGQESVSTPSTTSELPGKITENQSPIETEINAIKKTIEINGSFANIKEVKNSDGKMILECTGETPYIHIDALDDIIGFAQEFFQKTGTPLTLNSAYRTIENQKKLKKTKGKEAAEPGYSGHNLGLSIDIEGGDRYARQIGGIKGMVDLAKKYNFIPIEKEDWHFDHKTLPDADNRLVQAQSLDKNFKETIVA